MASGVRHSFGYGGDEVELRGRALAHRRVQRQRSLAAAHTGAIIALHRSAHFIAVDRECTAPNATTPPPPPHLSIHIALQ
eukprot:scaffold11138_cov111-Isochrysis_galbana.AAC.3